MQEGGRQELVDERVLTMIGAAVLSGAYSTLATEMPEAKRGLLKMARKHSARVAALAAEICAAAEITLASATMPTRAQR